MRFNFGKGKEEGEHVAEADSLERWRQLALNKGVDEPASGPVQQVTEAVAREEALSPVVAKSSEPVPVAQPNPVAAVTARAAGARKSRAIPSDPKLPVEEDLRRRFGSNLKSALGPGTVINGRMSFDSPVRIDGHLTGEVVSTSTLIVGEQATIEANIKVGSLVVLGEVKGPVEAGDLVEVKKGGIVLGDILADRLVIEEGGLFDGNCGMRAGGKKNTAQQAANL